jgi:Na+-transporting methylmalonyl-CoA/oxaloacetate decarboxylase beta subunit
MQLISASAAEIGVIGGADGPTAVLVSGFPVGIVFAGVAAVLLLGVIVALCFWNRK